MSTLSKEQIYNRIKYQIHREKKLAWSKIHRATPEYKAYIKEYLAKRYAEIKADPKRWEKYLKECKVRQARCLKTPKGKAKNRARAARFYAAVRADPVKYEAYKARHREWKRKRREAGLPN